MNSNVPASVAVPAIAPVCGPSVNPPGNAPEAMAHATGASPPVNDKDDEYASPMTADGVGQAVITNPPPTITSNWRSRWLPAESATRAVMRKVPEALGVPPI